MKRILSTFLIVIAFALPARAALDIQEVTSPGGIKAWLLEENSIPFVALEIRFKGGTSLDVAGKRGAIYMMSGLLEEGAGNLDSEGFAQARDGLAASFSFDANGDAVTVSARFLRENQDQALELLRLALQDPQFNQVALDRVRAQMVSIIAGDKKDPREIASEAFDRMTYGDHPYGTPSTGDVDTVNLFTREDMIEAWKNSMARDQMYVAAVGDISAEELGVVLDKLLGGLPEKGAPEPPQAEVTVKGGITVIDFPSPQSIAIFGHKGIDRADPDFFAAYVMNQVFGSSGFTSRLTNEVREKRGLTYGVYTYLASYDLANMFQGSVASANDRIGEAIDVIRAEWVKLAENGVTAKELEGAKKYLTGAYPLRFDGNARIATILVNMQVDNLPISYIKTRNDRVNAVTLEDVKRVAKRIMKPDQLQIVVVGQPVGVQSSE
ncbi:MAG: insulinase family protein [Alphaproteobacteria bacterium]|nr:insulinase family protein [Alphaproteobacteria bacterium]